MKEWIFNFEVYNFSYCFMKALENNGTNFFPILDKINIYSITMSKDLKI